MGGSLSVSGFVSAALLLAGSGCTADRDHAALIEVERLPGLGFCIESGDVLNGRIENEAMSSTFAGTVHLGWEDGMPECVGDCEITEPVGPTPLTRAERTELQRLIMRLPDVPCESGVNPACDPCLVHEVTVDGLRHDGNPCGTGCEESRRAVEAIGEFFDSLVP